jgi:hypothetical protein
MPPSTKVIAQDFRAAASRLERLKPQIPPEVGREIELLVQTLRDEADKLTGSVVNESRAADTTASEA